MTTAAQGRAHLPTLQNPPGSSRAPPLGVFEATFRAILIGSALGAVFSAVNLHLGFKIGLVINLSIPAALLAYFSGSLFSRGRFSILEANLAQTAASAGAAVAATGLVSAVPALTIVTGYQWTWLSLSAWLSALGVLGVAAAVIVRRQLIHVERLPFALGVATAGLLREMYDRSGNALHRLGVMAGAAVGAACLQLVSRSVERFPISTRLGVGKADQFGWALTLEPMFYAIGALIGLRAALSTLLGAAIAFGWLGPFQVGLAVMGGNWLVWPGVALLVVGSLFSLGLSLASVFGRSDRKTRNPGTAAHADDGFAAQIPIAVLAIILVVTLQVILFGIPLLLAFCAAAAAFLLAGIAGRVTGEMAITPSGPLAKTAQIAFGVARPTIPAENLVAANVAGGAASQCGELIHDLKCGAILGASWRWQAIAQLCGTVAGALAGAWLYLWLFPKPAEQLFTAEMPATAVRSLKAVAELLRDPVQAVPLGARTAMIVASIAAAVLTLLERVAPVSIRQWIPSSIAIGFGFLIPPWMSLPLAIGAGLGALAPKARPQDQAVCECGEITELDVAELCPRCGRPTTRATSQGPSLNRILVIVCVGIVLGQTFTDLGVQVYQRVR